MLIHVGNSVGAMSPDRVGALHGRFMAAFGARMLAGLDSKLASIAAKKKKPAATRQKAKPVAAKPKPVSRAARLRQAESEVKATQPRDARCCWADMTPA
jgi:hypothetical protein